MNRAAVLALAIGCGGPGRAPAPVTNAPPPPDAAPPVPPEPSQAVIDAELAKQCEHPYPQRSKAYVLELAGAGRDCKAPPYEMGSSSLDFCGKQFLDRYAVV